MIDLDWLGSFGFRGIDPLIFREVIEIARVGLVVRCDGRFSDPESDPPPHPASEMSADTVMVDTTVRGVFIVRVYTSREGIRVQKINPPDIRGDEFNGVSRWVTHVNRTPWIGMGAPFNLLLCRDPELTHPTNPGVVMLRIDPKRDMTGPASSVRWNRSARFVRNGWVENEQDMVLIDPE